MSIRKVTTSTNGAVDNASARRAGPAVRDAAPGAVPDPEVGAKPTRHRFAAEYKLRILQEAERQRSAAGVRATRALGPLERRVRLSRACLME